MTPQAYQGKDEGRECNRAHASCSTRYVSGGDSTEVPASNVREFSLGSQHGCIGSDVRLVAAERSEVGIVSDVAKKTISTCGVLDE